MRIRLRTLSFRQVASALSCALLLLSCSYSYKENYNFSKENTVLLDRAGHSSYVALLGDDRIKVILDGSNASEKKSLQDLLDHLNSFQGQVNGAAYAILIEGVLGNGDITQSNIQKNLATVVTMLESMLKHDNPTAVAGLMKDGDEANAVRAALSAYAQDRSSQNISAMIGKLYDATIKQYPNLLTSTPMASAIIFAASSQATEGSDNIESTIANLAHVGGSTVGDSATEAQKSGVQLIALLIEQMTETISAMKDGNIKTEDQQDLLLATARSIHAAGSGVTQMAMVTSSRLERNMLVAGGSKDKLIEALNKLNSALERRQAIATRARSVAASQSDKTLSNKIFGEIAYLNQLFSFVSIEREIAPLDTTTTVLVKDIADAVGDDLVNKLHTSNSTLAQGVRANDNPKDPDNSGNQQDPGNQPDPGPSYKRIYVTQGTFDGDLMSAATTAGGTVANGIQAADYLCMHDSNYPSSGTFKALIIDAVNRVACTTVNCSGGVSEHVDWVLAADTEYGRSAENLTIGTTNAHGIFDFSTDLENSIGSSGAAWTGMMGNWTSRGYNCGGWNGSGTEGDHNQMDSTSSGSVGFTWDFCLNSAAYPLICVEQ